MYVNNILQFNLNYVVIFFLLFLGDIASMSFEVKHRHIEKAISLEVASYWLNLDNLTGKLWVK